MSEQDISSVKDEELDVIFEKTEIVSSEDPPWEEWSSLECFINKGPDLTEKQVLFAEGLYQPPSSEVCAKYIPLSDSSVLRHPYYAYPRVQDPGIEEALLEPALETRSDDDEGQNLYKLLCEEMNEAYCRVFYKQLTCLRMNLNYYGISTYGWRAMAMALKINKTVRSINFTSNSISLDGCFHLGDMLLVNLTITELDFSGCRMGPEGIKRLVVHFPANKTLQKINLSKNKIGDTGLEYLSVAIYKGSNVNDINLSYNGLTSKGAVYLGDAIQFVNKITSLDLSWNSLVVPKPIETLISRFLENDKFVEINLSWNSLTNRFAQALGNLVLCPAIQNIYLSNNNLTGNVIMKIAENLPHAKKLKVLDLSFNPMTAIEAKRLAWYMGSKNVKLQKLIMDGVYVDKAFIKFKARLLARKAKKNCVITHGYVALKNVVKLKDMREIVLRRAQILCRKPKKKRVNVGMMLLQLEKERMGVPVYNRELKNKLREYGAFQMDDDLVQELALAFRGPVVDNERTTDVSNMADYVMRIWPDTKLPPTPPPIPPKKRQPIETKGKTKR